MPYFENNMIVKKISLKINIHSRIQVKDTCPSCVNVQQVKVQIILKCSQ